MPAETTGFAKSKPTLPFPSIGAFHPTRSCDTFADEIVDCATRVLKRSPLGAGQSFWAGGAAGDPLVETHGLGVGPDAVGDCAQLVTSRTATTQAADRRMT